MRDVLRRGAAPSLLLLTLALGCADRRLTTLRPSGVADGASDGRACVNLECRQPSCTTGACTHPVCPAGMNATSVSGTVRDPAGVLPLFNVVVYVPNATLDDIPTGATCDRCDAPVSGQPIAATITDERGSFVLQNVPFGADVPLVFQIGKWRRQVTLPSVTACANTAVDAELSRLPRNQSEGHLPRIAVATGNADALECLLRKVGVDEAEFTAETGSGRVHLYSGFEGTPRYAPELNGGAAFTSATTLWSDLDHLRKYDMLVLNCEGTYNEAGNKSEGSLVAMQQYLNAGGKLFGSHWQIYWLQKGPAPFPSITTFDSHLDSLDDPFTVAIDMSFPKGEAFASWIKYIASLPTRGLFEVRNAEHTVTAVNPTLAQRWIYSDALSPPAVQCFTANTPVGAPAAQQCGRMVFTDIHVSSGAQSSPDTLFPNGCNSDDLTPQEMALEFMLFDLSSCVRTDGERPQPPVIE